MHGADHRPQSVRESVSSRPRCRRTDWSSAAGDGDAFLEKDSDVSQARDQTLHELGACSSCARVKAVRGNDASSKASVTA